MAAQDKRIRESLEDALGSQQKKVWKMFQKLLLYYSGMASSQGPLGCVCAHLDLLDLQTSGRKLMPFYTQNWSRYTREGKFSL